MPEFRENFLSNSLEKLTLLSRNLSLADQTALRRDALRVVHTIKGGAQTFGLESAASFAAELETLLETAAELSWLADGLSRLAQRLRDDFEDDGFLETVRSELTRKTAEKIIITKLEKPIFDQLARSEKERLADADSARRPLVLFEKTGPAGDIRKIFEDFHNSLGEDDELIASLVGPGKSAPSEVVVSFLVTGVSGGTLHSGVDLSTGPDEARKFRRMLQMIAAHVEGISDASGKSVRLSVFANPIEPSGAVLDALFEIVLHLVRNSADHGIDSEGTIELAIFQDRGTLHVTVADDGRGIDLAAVRARAAGRRLISEADAPDDRTLFSMIFEHGFSTGAEVTDVSGRGVGLDAVKTAVEKLNGKISVRNRKTKGALFEIAIPT